jgi:hypothetical protein
MALNGAQEALIDRILEKARSGHLNKAFVSGAVEATMPNANTVRLRVGGNNPRGLVNDWVSTCAAKAGSARQRPSPNMAYVVIDMTI